MKSSKAWLQGDICYQTGLYVRSIVHLLHHGRTTKGHKFKSVQVNFKEDSVLIILKKESPKGPQIAFVEARSFTAALWGMQQEITSKRIAWKADKWAKKSS